MNALKDPSWLQRGHSKGSKPYPIPQGDSLVRTSVEIPMKDGTILRGDLHIPYGEGSFPGILEMTPYGAQTLAKLGFIYSSRSYLFLAVDCRGRYRSGGEWEPLSHDQSDGQDVLAWLHKHPRCNGMLGTRGHSYSGYNQLLTAIDAPDYLKAMVVGVAPGDPFYNTPFQGGAYDLNDLFWLLDMTGRVNSDEDDKDQEKDETHTDDEEDDDEEDTEAEKEHDALIDAALKSVPFRDTDLRLGVYHKHFRQWLDHWCLDDFWKKRSVLPHIDRIKAPALFISGWWDGNGRGSTLFYEKLKNNSTSGNRLLMGAYDHDLKAPDCDDLPDHEAEKIERAAERDCLNDELVYFDEQLLGLAPRRSNKAPVRLFVTGSYGWQDFEDWPPPESQLKSCGIHPATKLLSLSSRDFKKNESATYTFNPADPTPYGHEDVDGERIPFDHSGLQKSRNDLLLLDSPKLDGDLHVVGPISTEVYAACDAEDFDIIVSLYDVYPDGRSIFLTDGVLRSRFVESFEKPKDYKPGRVVRFAIDLWHLAHVFRKGHAMRLQIASAAYLRFDVNRGVGGSYADATESKAAKVTIVSSPSMPSVLHLPLLSQRKEFNGGGN